MDVGRRGRGSLEREVVAALAGSPTPLSPGQVRELVGTDLAYTTVMTVLTRLAVKGLVVRTRVGRGYVYGAVLDAAEITAQRMRRLLDTGGDRAAVLTRFVGGLTDDDERLLAELLRHDPSGFDSDGFDSDGSGTGGSDADGPDGPGTDGRDTGGSDTGGSDTGSSDTGSSDTDGPDIRTDGTPPR
jgi:predicted transcriptional regulator